MILTKHLGAALLRLGMTSHSKSHVGVSNLVRVLYILVNGDLVERRHETEQGEDLSFALGIEDCTDAEHRELAKAAKGAELLVIRRFPDCAVRFEDEDHRTGILRGRASAVCGFQ